MLIDLFLRSWCRSLFLQQTAGRQLEASARWRQISRHFEQDFWLMMEYIHYETIMELLNIHIYWFLSKNLSHSDFVFLPFYRRVPSAFEF